MTATAFRSKNKRLATKAVIILADEQPMTLRQLYYRLVSAGELKNSQTEYKRLGQVMTRLREAGEVPRRWMVDHTRSTLKPSSWSGLADFAETVRECYRKDYWASLPHHVEVFVEKDAVAGTIQPVTEENDIALRVCRGYSSVSFAGEIADFWRRIEKPIFAYYLGDFDPSGFDIERDLQWKIERYSGLSVWQYEPGCEPTYVGAEYRGVMWVRLGVTASDFAEHDLIRLPLKTDKHGKPSDKRAAGFIEQHGTACAEVDALPPKELRRRVEEAILSHIDIDAWDRLAQVEGAEQDTINTFVSSLHGNST